MEKHINVVAALHIGMSVLGIIIGIIAYVVLNLVGGFIDDPNVMKILPIVANVVIVAVSVLSIPGIIAGIGLFKRHEWARILTLILSVIKLLNVPVGTAVGAYSIWVLVQDEVVAVFKEENIRQL